MIVSDIFGVENLKIINLFFEKLIIKNCHKFTNTKIQTFNRIQYTRIIKFIMTYAKQIKNISLLVKKNFKNKRILRFQIKNRVSIFLKFYIYKSENRINK